MLALFEHQPFRDHSPGIGDRLPDADAVTAGLASAVSEACRHLPPAAQGAKTARIERLMETGAWTDAALALIDLELPQWRVRRIAYDSGEWYCALSRERELPDWLDQSIEDHHPDLPLAILRALVDARAVSARRSTTSVPAVAPDTGALYEPVSCDNFG